MTMPNGKLPADRCQYRNVGLLNAPPCPIFVTTWIGVFWDGQNLELCPPHFSAFSQFVLRNVGGVIGVFFENFTGHMNDKEGHQE